MKVNLFATHVALVLKAVVSSQVGSIIPNDPTGANVTFTIEEHVPLHSTSMEYQKDHSSPISLARETHFEHAIGRHRVRCLFHG
jgi:hypothetical protein